MEMIHNTTGERAPGHCVGTDARGDAIYLVPDGWSPEEPYWLDAEGYAHEGKQPEPSWDYEGYWNTVFGAYRDAAGIVAEFGIGGTERDLDEWLGEAESAAKTAGGLRESPESWGEFHMRALAELVEAVERADES